MKKELVIELEEECLICPNLSLVTKVYGNCLSGMPYMVVHQCEHLPFCKDVRKTWETVRKGKDEESR